MPLAALGDWLAHVVPRWRSAYDAPPASPHARLERLQELLHVAAQWPTGSAGDAIRRAACELIEAESSAARRSSRQRILKTIALVEWRRQRRRSRADDPSETTVHRLTEALRREAL